MALGDESAFPYSRSWENERKGYTEYESEDGMTQREYLEAKAMQALIPLYHQHPHTFAELVAEKAREYADAMLKAREATHGR